jgi:hypothetical protein
MSLIEIMCISQSSSTSNLLMSQVQQQTLGFLQRYASTLSDGDDDDDSLFGDSCSFEDMDTFDVEDMMHMNSSLHTTAVAAADSTRAEAEGTQLQMPHATSLHSLSSMTVLTNMSDFDLNKFVDDDVTVLDKDTEIDIPVAIVSVGSSSSDAGINVQPTNYNDQVLISDWQEIASLLERPESDAMEAADASPAAFASIEEARQVNVAAMNASWKSARDLQAWDRRMGLRRCHCKTMMDTRISRKRLLDSMGFQVPDGEKEIKRQRRELQRADKLQTRGQRLASVSSGAATVVSNCSFSACSSSKLKTSNKKSRRSPAAVIKTEEELCMTIYTATSA